MQERTHTESCSCVCGLVQHSKQTLRELEPLYCPKLNLHVDDANFEVRLASRFLAKWLVQQHHERQSHRVASGMERARPERAAKPPQPQPLACPIARLAESPQLGGLAAEDAALFKGNVPSQAE